MYPRRFNAYFSKPKQGTLELPLYSWALGPWSRLWHQENMFGKRNVRQAFTSRYLSSKVGWTREGGGGAAGAARLCHGRSRRNRHEPVLVRIPWDYCGAEVEGDAAPMATWSQVQLSPSANLHMLLFAEATAPRWLTCCLKTEGKTQAYSVQCKGNRVIWLGMSCHETKKTHQ